MIIPLRVDVPTWRQPWMNYLILAGTVGLTLVAFADHVLLWKAMGFGVVGEELARTRSVFISSVTSAFVHADILHLIGNMLFLWVFGNAVNNKFGHLGYAGLYLLAALASGLAHGVFDGRPLLGASGAIYGVMGAFLVFYPRNDVSVILFISLAARRVSFSSMWLIFFYVVYDAAMLWMRGEGSVALWGHLGGFTAGLAVALACALSKLLGPAEGEQTLLEWMRRDNIEDRSRRSRRDRRGPR